MDLDLVPGYADEQEALPPYSKARRPERFDQQPQQIIAALGADVGAGPEGKFDGLQVV